MEPASENTIPAVLLERLVALKPILETQGVIQLRQRRYRLRYRAQSGKSYPVHQSIAIGGDMGIVNAVEALLAGWRAERQARDAEEERKMSEARLAERNDQLAAGLFAKMHGGGSRRQRQLRDFYRSCQNDPLTRMRYLVTGVLPARRMAGRPRKLIWTQAGHTSGDSLTDYLNNLQRRREAREAEASVAGASAPRLAQL
jgi:hypothetical protein